MPDAFIAFIVIAVGALVIGAIYAAKAKKKRQMALAAWAASHGWHYTSEDVSSLDRRFGEFDCLTEGDNRYGYNVVRGEQASCDLWAFDYHYQTYSTNSKGQRQTHHHHFSAVIVNSGLHLEPLFIREEGIFDKMKSVFGFDDIDFESAEFSREFYVKAQNKRWAYDVINQRNMELLLHAPRFSLQFAGSHIVAWRSKRFKPEQFDQAVKLVFDVIEGIPRDIRERLAT